MKVLVTGATGFIGNHVVQYLLAKNYEVVATSSNEEKAKNFSWFNKVKYLTLNFNELNYDLNYFQYFSSPDIVIHLAWEGLPNYDSLFHFEENLPRHYQFLKNLVLHGAKNITVTGTCFEYGMQEGELSETMPALPSNAYAIAKDTLRKFLEQLQMKNPFDLKWARLFYMYGIGQNPQSLFSQLQKALDNRDTVFNISAGDQLRDYLPVEKMAEYIVRIALQNKEKGIINCCSGIPIKVSDLVEDYLHKQNKMLQLNKGFYPYSKNEPMNFWGNDEKLRKILF